MISKVIKIDIGQIVGARRQCRQDRGRPRYKQNYRGGNLRGNARMYQILKDKTVEESTEIIIEVKVIVEVEIGIGLEKDHFLENLSNSRNNRSTSNSRSRSGSRASINRDRIRCYKCREYDHFAKDCPTSREERELEQL